MIKSYQKNESLAKYTTFQIGGPAELFFIAKNKAELLEALNEAKNIPVTVIGGGSNLLISDAGIKGLVILNRANHYRFSSEKLYAESGVVLSKVARESIEQSLSGLDFAAGIPGTVGGAVVGNAGAYGKDIAACLIRADVWDGNLKVLENKDFNYEYRYSDLKGNNQIVLSAEFRLEKGDREAMEEQLKTDSERRLKLYKGLNCGSYFKNPAGQSAGELIDKAGLKGYKKGRVAVSENHANVLLNLGGATAEEMIELEKIIIDKVKAESEVTLEPEVVKIGF